MKQDTKERQCGRPGCPVRFTPEHAQRLYCGPECARLMRNAKAAAVKSRQRRPRPTHCRRGKPLDVKSGRGRPRKRCDDCRKDHAKRQNAIVGSLKT